MNPENRITQTDAPTYKQIIRELAETRLQALWIVSVNCGMAYMSQEGKARIKKTLNAEIEKQNNRIAKMPKFQLSQMREPERQELLALFEMGRIVQDWPIDSNCTNGICPECFGPLDIEGFCINVDCKHYLERPIIIDLPDEI